MNKLKLIKFLNGKVNDKIKKSILDEWQFLFEHGHSMDIVNYNSDLHFVSSSPYSHNRLVLADTGLAESMVTRFRNEGIDSNQRPYGTEFPFSYNHKM